MPQPIDLLHLDTDVQSAGVVDPRLRLAFTVLAKHVNAALSSEGSPPVPAPHQGSPMPISSLMGMVEAADQCVADGTDYIRSDVSTRGLGEMARELLELRRRQPTPATRGLLDALVLKPLRVPGGLLVEVTVIGLPGLRATVEAAALRELQITLAALLGPIVLPVAEHP